MQLMQDAEEKGINSLKATEEVQETVEGKQSTVGQPSLAPPFFHFWGHIASRSHHHNLVLLEQTATLQTPSTEPYNLAAGTNAATYSQWKQDTILLPILSQLGNGFFVESGAFDGEKDSNTLYYELKLGWRGLLVEPNPKSFSKLLGKHRRAYAYRGCLSPSDHAETLQFLSDADGRTSMIDDDGKYSVEAQPLHTLLMQIGQSEVDFWSLDIEGSESSVLQNTDFSKVEVGVLLIEMNKSEKNNREIREVMKKEGFQNIGHSIYPEGDGILDQIFVNPKYFQKRGLLLPSSESLAPQYRNSGTSMLHSIVSDITAAAWPGRS